jgi:hypothetical protein
VSNCSRFICNRYVIGMALLVTVVGNGIRVVAQPAPQPGTQGKARDRQANFDIRIAAPLRTALLQRLGRAEPADTAVRVQQATEALAGSPV